MEVGFTREYQSRESRTPNRILVYALLLGKAGFLFFGWLVKIVKQIYLDVGNVLKICGR